MALDIISLAVVALFFIRGFFKGFIVAFFSVVAILLGVLVSLRLSKELAEWASAKGVANGAWVPVLAYVILFIGVIILVNIIARLLQKLMERMMLGIINKVAGGILYALFSVLLWSILLWLGSHVNLVTPKAIASSKTYPFFAPVAPWCFEHTGSIAPFVKNSFSDLQRFFDSVQTKPQQNVGAH